MPFDETEREMEVLAVFRQLLGAPQARAGRKLL